MEENKLLKNVGTLIIPKSNAEPILFGDALAQEGVKVSRKFERLFCTEKIGTYEERELACRRVMDDSINKFNHINWYQFHRLNYHYILGLLKFQGELGLRADGSHNVILIDKLLSLWFVDIYKSRHAGWKIDVVDEVKLIYGEQVFSSLWR